jgi:hypothetical protein
MSSLFLIGAVFGSAIAIFGGREPARRLVQNWQNYLERRRDR